MDKLTIVCVFTICVLPFCAPQDNTFYYGSFPEDFIWGTATSSYQIEGGWNSDGKGANIWDTFSQTPNKVENNDTGNIACDSYNKYLEDVRLLKALGVQTYRFSLSWARILPDGVIGNINEPGIQYYNNLIDALLAEGITPMITLYHWDLPQALENIGGWYNEALVGHFTDYADLCYQRFGDRVKLWLTFNEPFVFTWVGYGIGVHAPGTANPADGCYKTGHTVIKAHAEAWHRYNDQYRATQQGRIAITIDSDWKEPFDSSVENMQAHLRAMEFKLGWYAQPIFGANGDYPEIMKEQVLMKSLQQGYNESRLPEFTSAEVARIKGTADFFGLNHYTTQLIKHRVRDLSEGANYELDQDTEEFRDPSWPTSGSDWLRVVPWGMRKLLKWIKDNYGDPEVFITENGMSDRNATLDDQHRIFYYRNYINEVLKARDLDGVNVIAYTAWSWMDNFEWAGGYSEKFGLHYVDFNNPDRPRTPKASANWYSQMIKDNAFIEPTEPTEPPITCGASSSVPQIILAATLCMFALIARH